MTGKPKATYDRVADAIGIYFAPRDSEYDDSKEVAPGIVLDYDAAGCVIGVELLHVSKLLATGTTDAGDIEDTGKSAAAE
jgi:uncharacterized protein YuzE